MSSHIGIEISRSACRIVELERTGHDAADTIVRSYAHATVADALALAPFRRRQAAVVAWGLHGEHRQALVTPGSYRHMRRQAVSATRQAGVETRQMLADIAPVDGDDAHRRTVVVALARTSDVSAALRTVTSAGIKVRSLVTPAVALMSLARLRRRVSASQAIEAYVAFEETGTALALVRGGALMAARELDWGYHSVRGVRTREDAAIQLGDAIVVFFDDCGVRPNDVAQICVCGGLPELRNMTLALMERLDVEVEPLDSLFGVDANHLPEPSDDFRERIVDLRLPWAIAADWNAPLDFLRERRRRMAKTVLTRAAVVAGVATGVAVAWRVQQSSWFQPSPAPVVQTTAASPPPRRVSPPTPPRIEEAVASEPQPAPFVRPAVQEPSRTAPIVLTPVPAAARPPLSARFETARTPAVASTAAPAAETPLPFDGSLGTILYGADRKLAIVDERIVQVGDEIRGARVVDITPDAVLLRDVQGRLRKLTLRDSSR